MVLLGSRDDVSREGEGNRAKTAGLRFCLEEADTRCSRLTDKAEALRFNLRANGGVKAELRRELENKAERRGTIEAEARTEEEVE